jgi:hypothetical protein
METSAMLISPPVPSRIARHARCMRRKIRYRFRWRTQTLRGAGRRHQP